MIFWLSTCRFLISLFILAPAFAGSQSTEPVKWSFSQEQLGNYESELRFTATIEDNWAIYSQLIEDNTGGIPTTFSFEKGEYSLITKVQEPPAHGTYDELYETTAGWFEKEVTFVVKVRNTIQTTIRGSIEYMVWNDSMPLPPETISFDFEMLAGTSSEQEVSGGYNVRNFNNRIEEYPTVKIGSQIWMSENLNVTTFKDGTPIKQATSAGVLESAKTSKEPLWCYYDFDPKNANYGKMYNGYAITDSRGLAPHGYKIPSQADAEILLKELGVFAGDKLRSTSGWDDEKHRNICQNCKGWSKEYKRKNSCHECHDNRLISGYTTSSGNGNNSSGFNAKPGGHCGSMLFTFRGQGSAVEYGLNSYSSWGMANLQISMRVDPKIGYMVPSVVFYARAIKE